MGPNKPPSQTPLQIKYTLHGTGTKSLLTFRGSLCLKQCSGGFYVSENIRTRECGPTVFILNHCLPRLQRNKPPSNVLYSTSHAVLIYRFVTLWFLFTSRLISELSNVQGEAGVTRVMWWTCWSLANGLSSSGFTDVCVGLLVRKPLALCLW